MREKPGGGAGETEKSYLHMSDWTRGDRFPFVLVALQCQNSPQVASNIPAAEVWYKVTAEALEGSVRRELVLFARWPCPCGEEHTGQVVRWRRSDAENKDKERTH